MTAYIGMREVPMTDPDTLMTLLSVLKGGDSPVRAMLPLLMSMMRRQPNGENGGNDMLPLLLKMMQGASAGSPAGEEKTLPRADGVPHSASNVRQYAVSPFSEIDFAGAEVRDFMETLWRIRRR